VFPIPLQRAIPWLLPTVAACVAGAWTLWRSGDAQQSDGPGLDAARAARATADVTTGAPLRSLSASDRRALCLAPVPADSRVRSALLGSMAKARNLAHRPDVWVDVGHVWLRQLRSTGDSGYALHAEACAEVAQEIAPDHLRALALMGLVRLDAHEFRAARELAESLLAREPDEPSALGILSDAALELGDVSAASDAAQRLVDRSPGLGAYARASYLRWLHGDEPGAIELARIAIDSAGDPNELETRAWILVQAAHLFCQRGDDAGAEAGYRMALQVRSDYAPALLGLGKVAAGRHEYGDAAESLTRALSAHADVETAALLSELLRRRGDAAGAARNEALAEQLGRHDRRALALFYANHGREPARAVELARTELAVRGDIYTEDALAWALYSNAEFAAAEQHAERALRLGTRDALLLYHLGAIRLALGKVHEAKALLEQALQQNPRFDLLGAEEARRLLARAGS
jgi:tetratricopeptide (TPR) repeat protein